jgi:hypothetical protein
MSNTQPSITPQLRAFLSALIDPNGKDLNLTYALTCEIRSLIQIPPTGHTKSVAELAHDRARAGCEAGSTASQGA